MLFLVADMWDDGDAEDGEELDEIDTVALHWTIIIFLSQTISNSTIEAITDVSRQLSCFLCGLLLNVVVFDLVTLVSVEEDDDVDTGD